MAFPLCSATITTKSGYSQAKEYILLLDTYSDVRIMEPDRKEAFFQEIEEAILGCGGMVRIRDIMDLHLGKNL